jgi:hypothetical protein
MRIKLKRSAVPGAVPDVDDLQDGEIAVNTADQKMFVNVGGQTITEVANKGQTADEVTAKAAVMAIALG